MPRVFARRAYCVASSKISMFVRPSSSSPPTVRHAHRIGTQFSDKKLINCGAGVTEVARNETKTDTCHD